jgi:DNA-binding CsgD family transcriptional regulator
VSSQRARGALQGGLKHSEFIELSMAASTETLKMGLVRMAEKMDFGYISAILVLEQEPCKPILLSIGNTPSEYLEDYHCPEQSRRDPVLRKLKRSSVPFIYDQGLYVAGGAGDVWERQAKHGFKTGVAAAFHLPHGQHFLLGVDRPQALQRCDAKITCLLASVQLLAAHALEPAQRLMAPQPTANQRERARPRDTRDDQEDAERALSARELEVLRWASDGKTAWETGNILSISEHTVNKHLAAVAVKLGCVGKAQAIARAFQQGLLR